MHKQKRARRSDPRRGGKLKSYRTTLSADGRARRSCESVEADAADQRECLVFQVAGQRPRILQQILETPVVPGLKNDAADFEPAAEEDSDIELLVVVAHIDAVLFRLEVYVEYGAGQTIEDDALVLVAGPDVEPEKNRNLEII